MKALLLKIPAFIAICLCLVSLLLVLCMIICSINENPAEQEGFSLSFAFWIFSILTAAVSIVFLYADGIISIISAIRKNNVVFNIILAVTIFISPNLLFTFGASSGRSFIIWNVYYLGLLSLEAVSIIFTIKKLRIKQDFQLTPSSGESSL